MIRRTALFRWPPVPVVALAAGLAFEMTAAACELPAQHAGLTFPVERIEETWRCRLQPIIANYTTANTVGPVNIQLSESLYRYLLDRPPTAAALINRLDLGLYRAETRGVSRVWGDDGEGTSGLVHLVYQDADSRVYFLEGTHESRLLPHVTGKAVVLVRMRSRASAGRSEAVETTLVSYTRLDNRVLSGLISLLRPLVGGLVTRKLMKGVDTINRLGDVMRREPQRVLFEAADPPALPDEDVAFLRRALSGNGPTSAQSRHSSATP